MSIIKNYKRALIISNNPLSRTANNGKTILSFFDDIDEYKLYQIYFKEEIPDYENAEYFKISEFDILKNKRKAPEGDHLAEITVKPNPVLRILRDIFWYVTFWKNKKIIKFIEDAKPDMIFFVAGDFLYPYHLLNKIKNKKIPLVTFITDDYILPYDDDNIFEKIRKFYLKINLKRILSKSSKTFMISEKMKRVYDDIFNINADVFMNLFKNDYQITDQTYDVKNIVYAGSLHSGRDKELEWFIKHLETFNKTADEKIYLDLYTNDFISDSEYVRNCGRVNIDELRQVYEHAWAFIFLESRALENIKKTSLSLSTKIPEYLSYGKPILCIGDDESYSIEYLKNVSIRLSSDYASFEKNLKSILNERIYKEKAEQSYELYQKNHLYSTQLKRVKEIFNEVSQ